MDGLVHAANGLSLAQGDRLLAEPVGIGDLPDGLGLALGMEDRLLLDTLCVEDPGLPLSLGSGDGRLAVAVGLEHHGSTGSLGLHLLVHGVHDIGGRVDALDLDTDDAHTPLVGRVIEHLSQLDVDGVAGGERRVEAHVADHVPQVGLGQLRDRQDEVGDVVDEPLGIGGLVVDDGIDRDGHVVLGDDLLGRDVDHLLAHVDPEQLLDDRDDHLEARVGGGLVATQLFDEPPLVGVHDLDGLHHKDEQDEGDDAQDD